MLNDNALITFAELQAAFPEVSATKQTYYEGLINGASSIADKITKRNLKAQDYELTLDGSGEHSLILPDYPVNSVASLNVDVDRAFSATTEKAETEYGVYENQGIIILYDEVVPARPLIVKVSFNAGLTAIPEDIKIAVMEIVLFLHQRRNGSLIGKKSVSMDTGISEAWETSIPFNALQMLDRYVKRR